MFNKNANIFQYVLKEHLKTIATNHVWLLLLKGYLMGDATELDRGKISREDALLLLKRVKEEGKLSVFVFSRVISACIKAGRQLLKHVEIIFFCEDR